MSEDHDSSPVVEEVAVFDQSLPLIVRLVEFVYCSSPIVVQAVNVSTADVSVLLQHRQTVGHVLHLFDVVRRRDDRLQATRSFDFDLDAGCIKVTVILFVIIDAQDVVRAVEADPLFQVSHEPLVVGNTVIETVFQVKDIVIDSSVESRLRGSRNDENWSLDYRCSGGDGWMEGEPRRNQRQQRQHHVFSFGAKNEEATNF